MSFPDHYTGVFNFGGNVYDFQSQPAPADDQFYTFIQQRPTPVTLPQLSPPPPTVFSAPGNVQLTALQLAPWSLITTNTTDASPSLDTYNFPTAAQLTAQWGGPPRSKNLTGNLWYFTIVNNSPNDILLLGNTGVVIAGPTTLPPNTAFVWLLQKFNNSSYNLDFAYEVPQIAGGGPGGPALLSATQTFTAVNTFTQVIVGSINGNAATATKLQTARTIAGVPFDGTANIAIASTGLSDSANIARLNAVQTFTAVNTFSSTIVGSINGNAATVTSVTAANLAGAVAPGALNNVLTSNGGGGWISAAPGSISFPITVAQGGTGSVGPFQLGDTWSGGGAGNMALIVSAPSGSAGWLYTSNGPGATPSWQAGAGGYTLTAAKVNAVGNITNTTSGDAGGLTSLISAPSSYALLATGTFASDNPTYVPLGGTLGQVLTVTNLTGLPTYTLPGVQILYQNSSTTVGTIAANTLLDSCVVSGFTSQAILRIYFSYNNSGGNSGLVNFYSTSTSFPLGPNSSFQTTGGLYVDLVQVPGIVNQVNSSLMDIYTGLNNMIHVPVSPSWSGFTLGFYTPSGFASTTDWTWKVVLYT